MKKLSYATCACCKEILHVNACFTKRYLCQGFFEAIHFCDEECHSQWLLERIRRNEA